MPASPRNLLYVQVGKKIANRFSFRSTTLASCSSCWSSVLIVVYVTTLSLFVLGAIGMATASDAVGLLQRLVFASAILWALEWCLCRSLLIRRAVTLAR